MNNYAISLNSDRVHLTLDGIPVETHLFSRYADEHTDGKDIAVGIVVCKALEFKGKILVTDLAKLNSFKKRVGIS